MGAASIGFRKDISLGEWRKVFENNGDMAVIIPDIKKDQPVENFEYIRRETVTEEELNRMLKDS
ncbi:MAG: hypothetical protein KAI63_02400, partial [Planctomycetes bacterium]|nr:hypothetical protein [Planctomycetota bacterium]